MSPVRALAAAALALAGAGCRHVVWHGHDPSRLHRFAVVEHEGRQWVERDDRAGPIGNGVGVQALAIDEAGDHCAYPIERDGRWHVVHDGALGPAWDGIGAVVLSPDGRRCAYAAERGGEWSIVVDGTPHAPGGAIVDGSLGFHRSGRLLYTVERDGRLRVAIDHHAGPAFDRIHWSEPAPRGERVCYLGRDGERWHCVVDGRPGPPFLNVSGVSAHGGRLLYVATTAQGQAVVIDGRAGPAVSAVFNPVISSDGRHVSWTEFDGERLRVHVGGTAYPWYPRPVHGLLALPDDGRPLYVADGWLRRGTRALAPCSEPLDLIATPDGRRWGLVERRDGAVHVGLSDGTTHGPFDDVAELRLGPTTGCYAFVAQRRGQALLVANGTEYRFGTVVSGTVCLSADGRHWAALTGDPVTRTLVVTIDGDRRVAVSFAEMIDAVRRAGTGPATTPRAQLLRRWVRAELDKHCAALGGRR